jgi:hypothetical protein
MISQYFMRGGIVPLLLDKRQPNGDANPNTVRRRLPRIFPLPTRIRIKRFDSMAEKKKRGRPRIRTVVYCREYHRQKQREWRAVHLYGCSPGAVASVLDRLNRIARPNGRLRRASRYERETTSRHAVKRDG